MELAINWKILLAQFINFAILFFLLKQIVYKPLLETLKKRREKIEEGVVKSAEAEEKLKKVMEVKERADKENEEKRKEVLLKAEQESKDKINSAIEKAEQERQIILAKSAKEAEELKEREKGKVQNQVIENAFLLAEKLIKENVDEAKNKQITEEFLKKIKA
ncbi:MAG: F0F1 ATP synthase subunit B [Candidatus Pacebacteria bacterium]|nr:F0F1 ATP synthase subunit B [Candidatus Paceibacterota bacterium]